MDLVADTGMPVLKFGGSKVDHHRTDLSAERMDLVRIAVEVAGHAGSRRS